MPQTTTTSAFNRYKAQEAAGGRRIILDEFVFANIPGLDASQPPTDTEGMPDEKFIVHRQNVERGGMVNENTVVYTVTLPTSAGNFTFNWMALINSESGTPAVITYLYPQQKIKNADGVQGNVLTYSEYMRYTGASTLTGITTPSSTWQIDFTARLHGMDEATRKVALDLYGNALFFGNGFKLTATTTPGLAELAPGVAYLRGLRTELPDAATLTFETGKEQTISLDSALTGSPTGENRTTFTLISHETADYTDSLGFRHYVEPVARIAPDGTITDLRHTGGIINDRLDSEFLTRKGNLKEIADKGEQAQKESRDNLNLGNSATRNTGTTRGTVAAGDDARILATKKAIDDTQTGLAAQPVMWISTADDLSNLPSGAHRFTRNKAPATVLPTNNYAFVEVIGKRDEANGSCILVTEGANPANVWIGTRYDATTQAAFSWIPLHQTVQNLGLTEAVNHALNAVQKTGDTMTGNLFLKGDARLHFSIVNEDGNARMWLYKDKGGDGIRINNGIDGGGDFVFGKDNQFYSPGDVRAGSSRFAAADGNIAGAIWGGWLSTWLNNQFSARDRATNARATIDWVNQYFATKNPAYLAKTGWFKDSSTGLILQWGEVFRTGYGTWVNFPIAFTSFCSGVFLTQSDSPVRLDNSTQNIHANSRTLLGFNYAANTAESSAFWLAIGG